VAPPKATPPVVKREEPVVVTPPVRIEGGPTGVYNPYNAWGHGMFWTGLALVGLGGGFHAAAASSAQDYEQNGSSRSLDSNSTWSAAAVTSYVVGGAAMTTGFFLWVLGPSDAELMQDAGFGVAPFTDGSTFGVTLGGGF
jgi:hypothetical protein